MIILLMLLHLTGPDGQDIQVNVDEIVSMRSPRGTDHFTAGTQCLVFTADGKYLSVKEPCKEIEKAIGGPPK